MVTEKIGTATIINADCMDILRSLPDNAFDLAIADPPYGIKNFAGATSRLAKYGQLQTVNDMKPSAELLAELFRVSKAQIIWGYNHLSDMLPTTSEFLFWYKHQPVKTYAAGELAWTSYDKTAHCIDLPYFGNIGADAVRIHPTQKPVKLYEWILKQYARPGMKILDPFGGSMSLAVACIRGGYEITSIELDRTYYEKARLRLQEEAAQLSLFSPEETLYQESKLFE